MGNLRANPDIGGTNGLTPPVSPGRRIFGTMDDGAARGRDRRRSRERERRASETRDPQPQQQPQPRAGIQTAQELEEICENIESRLATCENRLRKHAHEIAVQTEAQSLLEARSETLSTTIDETNDRMATGGVTIWTYIDSIRDNLDNKLKQ